MLIFLGLSLTGLIRIDINGCVGTDGAQNYTLIARYTSDTQCSMQGFKVLYVYLISKSHHNNPAQTYVYEMISFIRSKFPQGGN